MRTKNGVVQTHEILCKAFVPNVCVLIQKMFELGIKIDFQEIAEDKFLCNAAYHLPTQQGLFITCEPNKT